MARAKSWAPSVATSLPAPQRPANRRVEYFESPPTAAEAVMRRRGVQCLKGHGRLVRAKGGDLPSP